MKKTSSIAASLQLSGLLLLVAFFLVFLYTTLHESGHALAGLLAGGSVRQVNVNFFDLSAHAVLDGDFTRAQQALISISGWALPVLVYLFFLLLSHRSREPLLAALRWVGGACVLGSTLPWVVLPLVYLGGGRPADDVISFLGYSGLPPLAAALGFAASHVIDLVRLAALQRQGAQAGQDEPQQVGQREHDLGLQGAPQQQAQGDERRGAQCDHHRTQ